ncbi:hypothetical protein [Methylomusa anaerophila]|nr:hypothetical protein [Methylomusa anaerophila]
MNIIHQYDKNITSDNIELVITAPKNIIDYASLPLNLWDNIYNFIINNEEILNSSLNAINKVLSNRELYDDSWVLFGNEQLNFYSIEILKEFLKKKQKISEVKNIIINNILLNNALITFDFKLELATLLIEAINSGIIELQNSDINKFKERINNFNIKKDKKWDEKLKFPSNEVDHLIDIPKDIKNIFYIFNQAIAYKMEESTVLILSKIINKLQIGNYDLFKVGIYSAKGERIIQIDLNNSLINWSDYVVKWDQKVASFGEENYSIAELCKICLQLNEFNLPDFSMQFLKSKFYKAVLKISRGVILGLNSGAFIAEHTTSNPSIFFIGRDVILGKSFMLETNGGIIICSNSFLGGGFIPILIHTHKHINSTQASLERKRIKLAAFVCEKGARFPMQTSFLFETVDYINKKFMDKIYGISIE